MDADEWNCKVQKVSFVLGVFNNNSPFHRRCKYYLLLNLFFHDCCGWSIDKYLLFNNAFSININRFLHYHLFFNDSCYPASSLELSFVLMMEACVKLELKRSNFFFIRCPAWRAGADINCVTRKGNCRYDNCSDKAPYCLYSDGSSFHFLLSLWTVANQGNTT